MSTAARTVEMWCTRQRIRARKLVGRWLVMVDGEGWPVANTVPDRGPLPRVPERGRAA